MSIPESVRNLSINQYDVKNIESLFGPPVRNLNTNNGCWNVYERHGLFESQCVSVYHNNNDHRTIIYAEVANEKLNDISKILDDASMVLTRNVLEPKRFSWPPKNLVPGNETYLAMVGAVISSIPLATCSVAGLVFQKNELANFGLVMGFTMLGITMCVSALFSYKSCEWADEFRISELDAEAFKFLYGRDADFKLRDLS